jgi:tRNA pseudouridine38-40 synthase
MIQFDGTDFSGWQQQANARTVQEDLKIALRTLTGQDLKLSSSSRTDAGVHALAMPVQFHIDSNLPLKAFVLGLNSFLPHDLRILSAEEMPEDFHARFSALSKIYRYRILNERIARPLERRTSWHIPVPLDLSAMNKAAAFMVGEHDFSAFRAAQCDAVNPVRHVQRIDVMKESPEIVVLEVQATGFLRNMVRILAGTLVDVGQGRHPPEWVLELLDHGDRTRGARTAPPQGLFLVEVHYP